MNLDDALNRVNLGNLSAAALKVLEDAFDAEIAAVDTRIYRAISAGTLNPQEAVQAWLQKHSLHAIRRRLAQNVRAGASASASITPLMNGDRDGLS